MIGFFVGGTCRRQSFFNHLSGLRRYITFTNINSICNNTINTIDADINIYKTQNRNITIANAKKIQEMNQINTLTTQLTEEKTKNKKLTNEVEVFNNRLNRKNNKIQELTKLLTREK